MKNNINEWVAEKGYQKKWIAKQMGISQNVLSRWINGHSIPSLENAFKLAEILECKVDELFERKEGN